MRCAGSYSEEYGPVVLCLGAASTERSLCESQFISIRLATALLFDLSKGFRHVIDTLPHAG